MSELTGSTRMSKADCIADARVGAVQKQHLVAMEEQAEKYAFLERQIAAIMAATTAPPTANANTLTPDSARHAPTATADSTTITPPTEKSNPNNAPMPESSNCDHDNMIQKEQSKRHKLIEDGMEKLSVEVVGQSDSSGSYGVSRLASPLKNKIPSTTKIIIFRERLRNSTYCS